MNEFLEVLSVNGKIIGPETNEIKTKSLRLEVNEGEEMILGKEKIDQMDHFPYIGSIISKDSGLSETTTEERIMRTFFPRQ